MDQLVVFFCDGDLSSRLGTGVHIFLDLFQDSTALCFSVVDDVPVDNEASVVTS